MCRPVGPPDGWVGWIRVPLIALLHPLKVNLLGEAAIASNSPFCIDRATPVWTCLSSECFILLFPGLVSI